MDNLAQSEQATPAASDLTSLPPEILRRIVVTHLGIRDRFRAAAVCRTLRIMLDDPTAWADVERISIGVGDDKHIVYVYGVDGYRLGSWIVTSTSITELLKRSHPKQLDLVQHSRPRCHPPFQSLSIYGQLGQLKTKGITCVNLLLKRFQLDILSLIRDILPFLPSTLEYVRLCVHKFEDDYLPLFQRLAPSLKRLGIRARNYDQFILGSPADFTELESLVIEGEWKPGELQRGPDEASWLFLQRLPNLRVLSLTPRLLFEDRRSFVPERVAYEFYSALANTLNNRITPVAELCMDADFVPHIMSGMSFEARRAIETLCVRTLPADGYLYGQKLLSALPARLPGLRRLSARRLPTQDVTTLQEAFFAEHNASEDADKRLTIELRDADSGVTHETRGRVTVTVVIIGHRPCAHDINTLTDDFWGR